MSRFLQVLVVLLLLSPAGLRGAYHQVSYAPAEQAHELNLGVTYTLWVPEDAPALRSIIVHQHGCGTGACQGGSTAAYDLHWQGLARKWNSALLAPAYHQLDTDNCNLWSDPAQGSGARFLQALKDLSKQSGHPELNEAPWCLWGHSGGGFWAAEMLFRHPERVVAVWLRSGASKMLRGTAAPDTIPAAALQVPIICNPGVKEKTDRFATIWDGMLEMFSRFRAQDAPIAFAPDPKTSHECGDSRYLAVPFFDACLEMRLPSRVGLNQELRRPNVTEGWLVDWSSGSSAPVDRFADDPSRAGWLPNEEVARAWTEYIRTGSVSDTTAPPEPSNAWRQQLPDGSVELTWEAEADFESGIGGFIIVRDGEELARLPANPSARFGRPLFQTMSYHDTPERPVPKMWYVDASASQQKESDYHIITLNSVGLRSEGTLALPNPSNQVCKWPGPTTGMEFPGKHWRESSPAEMGVDEGRLVSAVDYLASQAGRDKARELVIIRNGVLIWKGDHVDHVHGVWSCTKSFTSTCLGLLIDSGKCSLDTLVADHVPALASRYGTMKLRHLASMTSGYQAENDEPQGGYTHGPSGTPFKPADSPLFAPGTRYAYWDSAMNLMGFALTRIGGEPLETLFRKRIAEPIGMNTASWAWGYFGEDQGIRVNGGAGNHGKHIQISALELARLGHLFLNSGQWNGWQLISSNWVRQATSIQVPPSLPLGHIESGIDGRGVYGFNWWVNGARPDGTRQWPNAPQGTYCASGHNNNRMFIVPEWSMVIVRLGLDQDSKKITEAEWNTFLAKVGEAFAPRLNSKS